MEENPPSRLEAISTRWSLLAEAHGPPGRLTQEAANALVLRYLPAIRRYVGGIVKDTPAAEDLTQDVIVRLMAGDFGGANPERGRFRDFLRTAIRNMVRMHWRSQSRHPTITDPDADITAPAVDEDAHWIAAWKQHLLDLAWKGLEAHERSNPASVAYRVLRLRLQFPEDSSDQLAERLSKLMGKPMRADTTRQHLRRARLRFGDLMIAEIARGLEDPTPEKIQDELSAVGLLDLLGEMVPSDLEDMEDSRA